MPEPIDLYTFFIDSAETGGIGTLKHILESLAESARGCSGNNNNAAVESKINKPARDKLFVVMKLLPELEESQHDYWDEIITPEWLQHIIPKTALRKIAIPDWFREVISMYEHYKNAENELYQMNKFLFYKNKFPEHTVVDDNISNDSDNNNKKTKVEFVLGEKVAKVVLKHFGREHVNPIISRENKRLISLLKFIGDTKEGKAMLDSIIGGRELISIITRLAEMEAQNKLGQPVVLVEKSLSSVPMKDSQVHSR